MRRIFLSALAAVTLGGACAFFHDDYPGTTCSRDEDCFIDQGERCTVETHRCEVPAPEVDTSPEEDSAPPDAPVDAEPDATDATTDATDATDDSSTDGGI